MWQWAGVGFGEEETYRLYLSLKGLAVSKDIAVRFWGKMITRGGDYYVAESRTPKEVIPSSGGRRRGLTAQFGGKKKKKAIMMQLLPPSSYPFPCCCT